VDLKLKAVTIVDLNAKVKKENLTVDLKFRLSPSKRVFSRIKVDLFFDGQSVKSFYVGIPYYFARQEEFPIRSVLSLKQIKAGTHTIKVEMAGLWPLAGPSDIKETTIKYKPVFKVSKIKYIPTVKRIEGPAIAVVTEEAKRLYQEMRERWKRELIARRER
jgi:hypothetical protein